MSQTFGIEAPHDHHRPGAGAAVDPPPARFLVLIDSASDARRLAYVLLASREPVAEFDASAPEVQLMTRGLAPETGATEPHWDAALGGHSLTEREAAEVYALDA